MSSVLKSMMSAAMGLPLLVMTTRRSIEPVRSLFSCGMAKARSGKGVISGVGGELIVGNAAGGSEAGGDFTEAFFRRQAVVEPGDFGEPGVEEGADAEY